MLQWWYADHCKDPHERGHSLFGNLSTLPDYNIRDLYHSVMICRSLWRLSQEGLFSFWDLLYTVWLQYLWLGSLSDGMQIFVKTLMRKTILFLGIFLLCLTIISVTYITQWWYADLCEDPHEKDYSYFGIYCTLSDYNICDLHHLVMICRSLWRPSWEGPFSFQESFYSAWL